MFKHNTLKILLTAAFFVNVVSILIVTHSSFAGSNPMDNEYKTQIWLEDTFEDFVDGTFDASGQNIYVSRDGKIRTINRFDLNEDGWIDLLFPGTHDNYSFIPATLASVSPDR